MLCLESQRRICFRQSLHSKVIYAMDIYISNYWQLFFKDTTWILAKLAWLAIVLILISTLETKEVSRLFAFLQVWKLRIVFRERSVCKHEFTGVTTREELLSPENKIQPTYYAQSFADFQWDPQLEYLDNCKQIDIIIQKKTKDKTQLREDNAYLQIQLRGPCLSCIRLPVSVVFAFKVFRCAWSIKLPVLLDYC